MPFNKTTWVDDTTYLSAENLNDIENTLDGNRLAPTAGGTGTAITVTAYQFTLTDGCIVSFVASANNSGAATTINVNGLGAKSAYKANTADAPTIVSGRMYVFWYNAAGTCFFLRAAATGDFVAADLLAGKTGSNDDDTDVVGTMPVYDAGDTLLSQNTDSTSTTSATYVKRKQVTIARASTYRVKVAANHAEAGKTAYYKVYKNGVAYGIEHNVTNGGIFEYDDLWFYDGDTCEIWIKKGDTAGVNLTTCQLLVDSLMKYTWSVYTD